MALNPESAILGQAAEMIEAYKRSMMPDAHHGKIRRYLAGDHDLPYIPRGARAEFKALAEKAITNWLPLISSTFAKAMWADGYRAGKSAENSKPWDYWQINGLDARQAIAHRGALEYGASYTLVLPGDPGKPYIRPLQATRAMAWYEDDDDEWPVQGLILKGRQLDGSVLWQAVTADAVYDISEPVKPKRRRGPSLELVGPPLEHGLGVVPLVRFRERLDGASTGVIWPHIGLQNRINEAVFTLLIALQYASFRQRWATGLAIPVDENPTLSVPNPDYDEETGPTEDNPEFLVIPNPTFGQPIEPFDAAVDRVWVSDDANTKFGDFQQTDTGKHLEAYDSAVSTLAALAEVPPNVLRGTIQNVSADALASMYDSTTRRVGEFETLFGESWEQTLRLAALADGDKAGATDTKSQIRWRDTEARSLAATVDALGKMVQMLGVPNEAAWERIPGVTDTDIQRWRNMQPSDGGINALANALTRQQQPAVSGGQQPAKGDQQKPPAKE